MKIGFESTQEVRVNRSFGQRYGQVVNLARIASLQVAGEPNLFGLKALLLKMSAALGDQVVKHPGDVRGRAGLIRIAVVEAHIVVPHTA